MCRKEEGILISFSGLNLRASKKKEEKDGEINRANQKLEKRIDN